MKFSELVNGDGFYAPKEKQTGIKVSDSLMFDVGVLHLRHVDDVCMEVIKTGRVGINTDTVQRSY